MKVIPAPEGVADPARPVIPETFESVGSSHIVTHNDSIWGMGRWAIDEPNGHGVENWIYSERHHRHHVHHLQRFDLGHVYTVFRDPNPPHHHVCRTHDVKPPMPAIWAWVKDANYIGKHKIGDHTYDQWQLAHSGLNLTVSVGENQPNRPYFFSRRSATEHFEIHFISFDLHKPNASWFDVPKECKNATDFLEIPRPAKESPQIVLGPLGGVCNAAVDAVLSLAKPGCPYIYGGNGPCASGFDNDGLVTKAYALAGRVIPRLVAEQQEGGEGCVGGVQPGDLLFEGSPATHVAMALGNGMIAECPLSGDVCRITLQPFGGFNGGCRRYC